MISTRAEAALHGDGGGGEDLRGFLTLLLLLSVVARSSLIVFSGWFWQFSESYVRLSGPPFFGSFGKRHRTTWSRNFNLFDVVSKSLLDI